MVPPAGSTGPPIDSGERAWTLAGTAAPVSLGAAANLSDAESDGVETIEEGGDPRPLPHRGRDPDRRDLQRPRRGDPLLLPALDGELGHRRRRPWPRPERRLRQPRPLRLRRVRPARGPQPPEGGAEGPRARHGHRVRGVSAQDRALAGAISGSHGTFEALAAEDEALAESFQILPTFERESRLTFEGLDEFQADTRPLIQELIPVARDLSPTLRSVRRLSPDLRSLFEDLDVLIDASRDGLPALGRTLDGLGPVLDALDPFLGNLNPGIRYLEYQKSTVTDFLAGPGVALAN
jgi:hypothetical protein